MLMATHHNQEQSGNPLGYPSYLGTVRTWEYLSGDERAGKHVESHGFLMQDSSFHGDEKEMHSPPKPKTEALLKHKIDL